MARTWCFWLGSRPSVGLSRMSTGGSWRYALAKGLGRNYGDVQRDVQALMAHELIAEDEAGQVYVPWDSVEIRVRL